MRSFIAALCTITLLSACASGGVSRDSMNQMVEVVYANVTHTKPVKFESKAGEAAIVGAITGAVEGAHYGHFEDVVAGAIVGAVLSSVVVTVEEGPRDGLLLKLTSSDDTHYSIISNRTDITIGDCLELIQGDQISVLPVDTRLCQLSGVNISEEDVGASDKMLSDTDVSEETVAAQ